MEKLNGITALVLEAREQRYHTRKSIADQQLVSISLTLNIPGYPKSDETITAVFSHILADLHRYLTANRVFIIRGEEIRRIDEAGDFYIVPVASGISALTIKGICESFEAGYPLGRLVDIDITDRDFNPVSSGKAKACFICKTEPAVSCMRQQTHGKQELRQFISLQMESFLARHHRMETCRNLTQWAMKALLYEISLTPKPGAVDRSNRGSHQDMDYITFLNSTAAISSYFQEFAAAGYDFKGLPQQALPGIRFIGLQMEKKMFEETGGVNTQKGIIFLVGLTLFTAASVIRHRGGFLTGEFISRLKSYTHKLTETELKPPYSGTHGESCAARYGTVLGGGIRIEAEQGFPTVFEYGLPALRRKTAKGFFITRENHLKEPLIYTLLSLMSVTNDANILYRKGPRQLQRVKEMAAETLKAMDANPDSQQWNRNYKELMDYCLMENISPGGSSDLLAITVLLYFIEEHHGI